MFSNNNHIHLIEDPHQVKRGIFNQYKVVAIELKWVQSWVQSVEILNELTKIRIT